MRSAPEGRIEGAGAPPSPAAIGEAAKSGAALEERAGLGLALLGLQRADAVDEPSAGAHAVGGGVEQPRCRSASLAMSAGREAQSTSGLPPEGAGRGAGRVEQDRVEPARDRPRSRRRRPPPRPEGRCARARRRGGARRSARAVDRGDRGRPRRRAAGSCRPAQRRGRARPRPVGRRADGPGWRPRRPAPTSGPPQTPAIRRSRRAARCAASHRAAAPPPARGRGRRRRRDRAASGRSRAHRDHARRRRRRRLAEGRPPAREQPGGRERRPVAAAAGPRGRAAQHGVDQPLERPRVAGAPAPGRTVVSTAAKSGVSRSNSWAAPRRISMRTASGGGLRMPAGIQPARRSGPSCATSPWPARGRRRARCGSRLASGGRRARSSSPPRRSGAAVTTPAPRHARSDRRRLAIGRASPAKPARTGQASRVAVPDHRARGQTAAMAEDGQERACDHSGFILPPAAAASPGRRR